MNATGSDECFVLLCDEYGEVKEVVQGQGLPGLEVGVKLLDLVGRSNHFKLLDFLAKLRQKGVNYDWEFVLLRDQGEVLVRLSGVVRGQELLIVGQIVAGGLLDLVRELMAMSNEQTNDLRRAIQEKQKFIQAIPQDKQLFDEMSRMNNDMMHLQRELAKKNGELEHLNTEVEALADTDSLTGLLNRRGFFQVAEQEWKHAARYLRPTSAIMFDIDHFKKLNDTYGHATGDQVLREVGHRITANLRKSDIVGRYGGEEFCVLLLETSEEHSLLVAEKVRLAISQPLLEGSGPQQVTVSLGIAGNIYKSANLDDLLHKADLALYQAKESGRNRTCLYKE